jgi:hypothetical protein
MCVFVLWVRVCIYINIYIPLYVTYKCTNTLLHTYITSILNVYIHTPLKCMCMQLITHEHTATHIYLKLIVCRYLSAACWPGAEPLRFREALHGPGKVVFLFFREYFVGDLSIPSRLEYNLSISAISWFERAVIVRLRLTRYPAKASTASHPGMPLGSHRLSCHMK